MGGASAHLPARAPPIYRLRAGRRDRPARRRRRPESLLSLAGELAEDLLLAYRAEHTARSASQQGEQRDTETDPARRSTGGGHLVRRLASRLFWLERTLRGTSTSSRLHRLTRFIH